MMKTKSEKIILEADNEYKRTYEFRGIQDGKEIYHLSNPLNVKHLSATHSVQDFAYDPQRKAIAGILINDDGSVEMPPDYAFVINTPPDIKTFLNKSNYRDINAPKKNRGFLEIGDIPIQKRKQIKFKSKQQIAREKFIIEYLGRLHLSSEIIDFLLEKGYIFSSWGTIIPLSILSKFADNYDIKFEIDEDNDNKIYYVVNNITKYIRIFDSLPGNPEFIVQIGQYQLYSHLKDLYIVAHPRTKLFNAAIKSYLMNKNNYYNDHKRRQILFEDEVWCSIRFKNEIPIEKIFDHIKFSQGEIEWMVSEFLYFNNMKRPSLFQFRQKYQLDPPKDKDDVLDRKEQAARERYEQARKAHNIPPPDINPTKRFQKLEFESIKQKLIELIKETMNKVQNEKIMIIMRGLPGAGKSTKIKQKYPFAIVCSADDYFINKTGQYQFDSSKIREAHNVCYNKALNAVQQNLSPIVIDNTNTQKWEFDKYIQLANRNGYKIIIDNIFDNQLSDEELAKRNTHGVPLQVIQNMRKRFEL